MKKLLTAAVTAGVLTLSPTAAVAAPTAPAAPAAQAVAAAPAAGSVATAVTVLNARAVYPDTVRTKSKVIKKKNLRKKLRNGKRPKLRFRVDTIGNATPRGRVIVRIKAKGYKRVINRKYNGGVRNVKLPRLPKGKKYTVTVRFKAPKNSVYKNSKTQFKVRVKK